MCQTLQPALHSHHSVVSHTQPLHPFPCLQYRYQYPASLPYQGIKSVQRTCHILGDLSCATLKSTLSYCHTLTHVPATAHPLHVHALPDQHLRAYTLQSSCLLSLHTRRTHVTNTHQERAVSHQHPHMFCLISSPHFVQPLSKRRADYQSP